MLHMSTCVVKYVVKYVVKAECSTCPPVYETYVQRMYDVRERGSKRERESFIRNNLHNIIYIWRMYDAFIWSIMQYMIRIYDALWNMKYEIWNMKYEIWNMNMKHYAVYDTYIWRIYDALWNISYEIFHMKYFIWNMKYEIWIWGIMQYMIRIYDLYATYNTFEKTIHTSPYTYTYAYIATHTHTHTHPHTNMRI